MKKTPGPTKAEPSAPNSAQSIRIRGLTPRQARVAAALCNGERWIPREEIDRIAGASNGPQVIAELRHGWAIEIDMERVTRLDRDGRPCKPGQYRITTRGRERLSELQGDANG